MLTPARALFLAATVAGTGHLEAQVTCDFSPTAREVVLDTNLATVQTSCGPVTVAGGVFVFRNVLIPAGVTVRGEGTNPLIFVVTGSFVVDGVLSVRGGDGARVDTLNSANFPTAGGVGVCGGSSGGLGSPSSIQRSVSGEAGWAFANTAPGGGQGGALGCLAGCGRGSAGGGGTFGTAGDPDYPLLAVGNSFVQQLGVGGFGCLGRTLPGGQPGAAVFVDAVADNDFFGVGVDLFRRRVVAGELRFPIGGQGGGGGGDRAVSCAVLDPAFVNDAKGGGGGAGGGVLGILALGAIRVGPQGLITADGGHGGGGEPAGSNNDGGGGGGGSGGMIVLASTTGVELEVHGGTYANGDYAFSVSADGGVGTAGAFGGHPITAKYPPVSRTIWDQRPIGGFGGLGVVEFVTPFGNNADGTNTIFDDSVHVLQNGVRLTGAQKQRYLGWRGWLDPATGRWVDDAGSPTNAVDGDIRPAPKLLPLL